jgi:hypothetical protein
MVTRACAWQTVMEFYMIFILSKDVLSNELLK